MKLTVALVALLLLPTVLRAQNTATPIADSLRAAGAFDSAIEAYHAALKGTVASGEETTPIAYALASTYALSGQYPDSAFKYLDQALENEMTMRPLYDPDLYFLVDDPRWRGVEERQLDRLADRLGDSLDREYARVLLDARMNEWAYRYHIMLAFRTLGPESPVLTALSHAMQEHHGDNEDRILGLLDVKGWPRHSAVSEEAAYAAGNIVTHADLATRQKYLPMLEAACEAGEADWSDFAPILDRTELELGRPQVYGTQMEMNEETGRYEPRPMIDPDHVDDRRAVKGMESLDVQLERFNESMKRDFGG